MPRGFHPVLSCLWLFHAAAMAADLRVVIDHRVESMTDANGTKLDLTRLDYILTEIALQRGDGTWIGKPGWAAYVHYGSDMPRATLQLRGLPAGTYRAVSFFIGPDPATDKGDPTRLAPDHPLHPNVNGLHWGWKGGYIFMALEGRTGDAGFSHHLAGDGNRMRISLPAEIDLTSDQELRLLFDSDRVYQGRHGIRVENTDLGTHSGNDGGLARRIADQVEAAWSVSGIGPLPSAGAEAPKIPGQPKVIHGTPYQFEVPPRFPLPALPPDNPLTVEGIELGRRLFHETRLSRTSTQSCVSCHDPAFAFTDHGKRLSTGVNAIPGTRNSMPLANLAWKDSFFWDGRAKSLREQALMPIQDHVEMDDSLENVVAKLSQDTIYQDAFHKAFGSAEVSAPKIGLALEQFLLTLVSGDSKFDRAMRGEARLDEDEQRGFQLFFTESDPGRGIRGADCFHCHGGADFSDHRFHNNGLDDESGAADTGRMKITGLATDRAAFVTPSLRNIALTAPYMHDGRFATLEEVIAHYAGGVKRSATLDPNLAKHAGGGVPLDVADQRALIAFLKSLTDESSVDR